MKTVPAVLCDPAVAPDCDCPFEHWHVGEAPTCLDIHFEEDGSVHARIDAGDWEAEVFFKDVHAMEQARVLAFEWAASKLGETYTN